MVRLEKMPHTQGTKMSLPRVDLTDTYATTNHVNSLEEIANLILTIRSRWVIALFKLRNFLVKLVGLKTTQKPNYHNNFEVGGYIGFFKIFLITTDEIVLGMDDSHLNFRLSIHNSQSPLYNIKATTLVEYNNAFGRFYMAVILPFHHIVIRKMVKQAFKNTTS